MRFEWKEANSKANQDKHGVSFDEARSVFFDELARLIDDPEHSTKEDRFIILGISSRLRVLIVCHCYRSEDVIRIISARKASRHETSYYHDDHHA